MSKSRPTVDWVVVENDTEWERLRRQPAPATNHCLYHKHAFWRMMISCILLASVAGYWWLRPQASLPPTTAAKPVPVQSAAASLSAGQRSLVDTVVGAQNTRTWRRQFNQAKQYSAIGQINQPVDQVGIAISRIELLGDRAVVNLITTEKRGAPAYRQTRFYQQTATGWQQTAPVADLWGAADTLETPFFIYHFRKHDGAAVAAIAPQIDALYIRLRSNFGVPIAPDTEKLMIEISVTQPPGLPLHGLGKLEPFTVASPALYLAPVALTDTELLAQSLALLLIEEVSAQASVYYAVGETWRPLFNSIRLWQLWQLELPLADWRADVVQWLYTDLSAAAARQPLPLPDRYADLCAVHQLWLLSPLQVGIPLLCSRQQLESIYFSSWYYLDPPTRLAQLKLPLSADDRAGERQDRGLTVALAILIEYAVSTYGQEQLPVLVASLGHHESWETLIPAVYGVSAAEFEAGWQAYLAKRYGVSLETITP